MTTTTTCHECGAPTKRQRRFCVPCTRARDESTRRLLRQFTPEENRRAMATSGPQRYDGWRFFGWAIIILLALFVFTGMTRACTGDTPCDTQNGNIYPECER